MSRVQAGVDAIPSSGAAMDLHRRSAARRLQHGRGWPGLPGRRASRCEPSRRALRGRARSRRAVAVDLDAPKHQAGTQARRPACRRCAAAATERRDRISACASPSDPEPAAGPPVAPHAGTASRGLRRSTTAVGTVAATAWTWPRWAGRRPRSRGRRGQLTASSPGRAAWRHGP
jgi:hypothetical protein